ncbi:MAG TPA: hypothetical protein VHQ90_15005 [Thermoanaerobaculia bacterium]|nr:hypothetical protein [Thermoanaerobaculia bacterium]
MTLREIQSWRYSIYALCDESGSCQVEHFLLESRQAYPRAVRDLDSIMRQWVPQHGPPFEVEERARKLRDEICEFKAWEKVKKQKRVARVLLRVLFFEDGAKIICTSGFVKTDSTPDDQIDEAVELRATYFQEKEQGVSQRILQGWGV